MAEITLEFIAERLERIQTEQAGMRADLKDMAAGLTVLTEMVLRLARDMVQVKDLLGRLDNRISMIERSPAGH